MGYGVYKVGKRWGGYAVPAYCEHPACNEEVDRGMGCACGEEPFSEVGCDRYFCGEHLMGFSVKEGDEKCAHENDCDCTLVRVCDRCGAGEEPFPYKPEHPKWVYHLLHHKSWKTWRDGHPLEVKELQKLPIERPEYEDYSD